MVCLSLANFRFLPQWEELFSYKRPISIWFVRKTVPSPVECAAMMTAVLLLAVVLYGGVRLARRRLGERGFRWAGLAAFGVAMVPLGSERDTVVTLLTHLRSGVIPFASPRTGVFLMALAGAAAIWPVWRYQRRVAAVAGGVVLVLSPFCLLTFGEAVAAMATYSDRPYRDGPLAARLATAPPATRVVWIVFDEWDYRLSFVDRPADLAMPQIDRLRGESLFATGARSPFLDTFKSLPSLITGRRLEASIDASGIGIVVASPEHKEAKPAPWDGNSSVFSAVRKSGFSVGLVGWYFPYCRIMNAALSECAWWPLGDSKIPGDRILAGPMGTSYLGKVGGYSLGLLEMYGPHWSQYSFARYKAGVDLEFMAESTKQAADPALGLVFLHAPVPHGPHTYDRFTGRMGALNRSKFAYIDSLALMDRLMGELRASMESNGTWDRTVLVISSDHPFRESQALYGKSDRRVPFLVRFPGRPTAGVVTAQFATIVSANLVRDILRGSVSTVAEASDWIERRQGDRESPVETGN